MVQHSPKNEENLSSSEGSLNEKQLEQMFNNTTKFQNNNETPKKLHISLLIDESSIKKRPLGNSINSIILQEGNLEQSADRRSMTLSDTDIKRLRNSGLSPLRIFSTDEQDELNILAEEQ